MADAIAYVTAQKEHHRALTLLAQLELACEEDDGPAPWNQGAHVSSIRVIREPVQTSDDKS
jgi:hypothetical protein